MNNPWIKSLARLLLPVYQYESDSAKIVYAGYSSIKKNYHVHLLMDGNSHHTFLGWRWYWKIPDLIKSGNIDMVISEISQYALTHFQKYRGFILPEWAIMRINIDRPIGEICKGSVSDFSDIKRLIRKYNLTYEILTDEESFNYFYNKIYLPYIIKRYGDEALVEDLSTFWKSSSSPFLLAIKENGIIVAESMIRKSGDLIYLMRLGLLDGNEEYKRHGAIGAMYYFSVLEGQKMSCRYLDVGGTRPFLNNGLTKYKMGLGAEFLSEHSSWKEYLWFGMNKNSTFAKEFIRSNPFLYLNNDRKLVIHTI
jgi:hypothetical protein